MKRCRDLLLAAMTSVMAFFMTATPAWAGDSTVAAGLDLAAKNPLKSVTKGIGLCLCIGVLVLIGGGILIGVLIAKKRRS